MYHFYQPQNILQSSLIVDCTSGRILPKILGRAVDTEHGSDSRAVARTGILTDTPHQGQVRDVPWLGAPGNAGNNFSVDALTVDAALSGEHQVGPLQLTPAQISGILCIAIQNYDFYK